MRILLLVAALAGIVRADERATVAVVIEERPFYVGEPIPVELRIEIDSPFFRESGVQLFQSELQYPLHVSLPWWRKWRHGKLASKTERDPGGPIVGLNDDLTAMSEAARADAKLDIVLTRTGTLSVREPGTYDLAAPRLRYAFATKFRDDFLGRKPLDRRDVVVEGNARKLDVRAVPEEGRPDDYCGALGRFRLTATASRTDAGVDEPFEVVIRIEGEGNLATFDTPAWNDVPGIHKLSSKDDRGTPSRTIRCEFYRTRADVEVLPALRLSYFDPRTQKFATTETEPIGLSRLESAPPPEPKEVAPKKLPWPWIGLGALGVAILLIRRTRAHEPDERERTARAAAAAVADPACDPAETFVQYLAVRLDCPQATVIASDLAKRIEAAGATRDAARRAAALVEDLVAMRYAGAHTGADHRDRARTLTAELESAWAG